MCRARECSSATTLIRLRCCLMASFAITEHRQIFEISRSALCCTFEPISRPNQKSPPPAPAPAADPRREEFGRVGQEHRQHPVLCHGLHRRRFDRRGPRAAVPRRARHRPRHAAEHLVDHCGHRRIHLVDPPEPHALGIERLGRRREPEKIEGDPAKPGPAVGFRGRLQPLLLETRQDEVVDGIAWPAGVVDGGRTFSYAAGWRASTNARVIALSMWSNVPCWRLA